MSAVLLESLIRIHESHMTDARDIYQLHATARLLIQLRAQLQATKGTT